MLLPIQANYQTCDQTRAIISIFRKWTWVLHT